MSLHVVQPKFFLNYCIVFLYYEYYNGCLNSTSVDEYLGCWHFAAFNSCATVNIPVQASYL